VIPKKPGEQCAHARDILAAEDNAGFMNGELTQILVDIVMREAGKRDVV